MNDPNGGPAPTPTGSAIQSDELRSAVAQELARIQAHQPPPAPASITYAPQGQYLNLDEQVDEVDLSPLSVKIGGEFYKIRRDMTAPEVMALLALVNAGADDVEFLTALMPGTDKVTDKLSGDRVAGAQLDAYLSSIPMARCKQFVGRLGAIAGIPGMGVEMGELSAR